MTVVLGREREMTHQGEGWSDAATRPGPSGATKTQTRQEGSSLEPQEKLNPADTLISNPWPPALREYIPVALSHPMYGDLIMEAPGN